MLRAFIAAAAMAAASACASNDLATSRLTPDAVARPVPRTTAFATPPYDALGDSMTYGYGTPNPATQSYPADIGAALTYRVTDLGIDGITASGMLTSEVPEVSASAHLVTIMIGVNDEGYMVAGQETLWTVVGAIADSVNAIKAKAPAATILLVTPIDRSLLAPTSTAYPPVSQLALYHRVTQAIDQNEEAWGYPVCDVGNDASYYADSADFYTDGFHPSAIGAQHIAADIERCLAAL